MSLFNTILDIFFPVNCLVCKKNGGDMCLQCLLDCPSAERECADWIYPLLDYRHPPIKKAIHLLKYRGRRGLAKIFAEALHGKISEELSELSIMENFRNPILVPIPLAPKRKRERGFNQAELICKELIEFGKMSKATFEIETDVLIKPKDTEHQARITDRRKRLQNIIDSFAIKNQKEAEKIKDRNIILIDDVATTGATLNEARKILKSAGARKVIAFTVAH